MKRFFSITLLLALVVSVKAQITGEIYDTDGYPIPLASAIYKGHHVAEASDLDGKFKIARHNGWELTFSSVGFQPQTIKVGPKTPSHLKIVLKEDAHNLGEVVIKQKREHYSRKNNPAVELMKRVIAAKKRSHLENYDYYQYNKYQKITFSLNDIKPADLDSSKFFKKRAYVKDQIETSPYNGKLILPVSVDETVTQHIYRKDPKVEKDIIKGQRSEGVNNVLQTGEILNTMLREVFTDVDIYDDHMRPVAVSVHIAYRRDCHRVLPFLHSGHGVRRPRPLLSPRIYSEQSAGLRFPWRTIRACRLVAAREALLVHSA